jgi:hypothetical protein
VQLDALTRCIEAMDIAGGVRVAEIAVTGGLFSNP